MNTPDWSADTRVMLLFAGKKFSAHAFGYHYEWQAQTWIGARNDDRKPFLMDTPIKRLPGCSKQGALRRMHVFHAEQLQVAKLLP